jgi:hypothetical protein
MEKAKSNSVWRVDPFFLVLGGMFLFGATFWACVFYLLYRLTS